MKPVRLTRPADDDLGELLEQSRELWGDRLTDRYEEAIVDGLDRISQSPERFPLVGGRHPGVRRLRVGRHVLYFRQDADVVVVIRILHERMDWRRKL
jgi:toxin ParE1/3/4